MSACQRKPRLLDLFCCGGGAAHGYAAAGFEVVGVDIVPQPEYSFEFHCGDAIEFAERHGSEFDVIHASPPCQGYSKHVSSRSSKWSMTKGKDEPRLIAATRDMLKRIGKPYIIENVVGAKNDMDANLMLCGVMFGLPLPRHRLFEVSVLIDQPKHPNCRGVAKRYAEERGLDRREMTVTGKGRTKGTSQRWSEIMGIDWPLRQRQITEAIPPSYTHYIGSQVIRAI